MTDLPGTPEWLNRQRRNMLITVGVIAVLGGGLVLMSVLGSSDPDYDLRSKLCTSSAGLSSYSGELVNTSGSPRTFRVDVDFLDGETRIDRSTDLVRDVAPGERVRFEVLGRAGANRCRANIRS